MKTLLNDGVVALLFAVLSCTAFIDVANAQDPPHLTLHDALGIASSQSPSVAAARFRVDEATGPLRDARRLLGSNPFVSISAAPWSTSAGASVLDAPMELAINQRFELPGARAARIDAGQQRLHAAKAGSVDYERTYLLDVALTFENVIATARVAAILAVDQELTETLFEITRRRVERGADAPLALSAARIRRAESQRRALRAEADERAAAAALASILGMDPGLLPVVVGDLPTTVPELPTVDVLVAQALESRPDLVALTHRLEQAQAERRVARRSARPDLILGVRYDAIDGDPVTLATAGMQVPLFDRNQGERASAGARVSRFEMELQARRIQIESEVRIAWQRRDVAIESTALYDRDVTVAFEESISMLTKMFEAGKVAYGEVLALQRERLDGQLGFVDAQLKLAMSDLLLRTSAGVALTPTQNGEER